MKKHERTSLQVSKDTVKELENIEGYPMDKKIQKLLVHYWRTKEATRETLKEIFMDDFVKFMEEKVHPEVQRSLNSLKESMDAIKNQAIKEFQEYGTGLVIAPVLEKVTKLIDRRLKDKELSHNLFTTADTL